MVLQQFAKLVFRRVTKRVVPSRSVIPTHSLLRQELHLLSPRGDQRGHTRDVLAPPGRDAGPVGQPQLVWGNHADDSPSRRLSIRRVRPRRTATIAALFSPARGT